MKFLSLFLFFCFIGISIVLVSCEDDELFTPVESVSPMDLYENFGAVVEHDFLGQVVNQDNEPIQYSIVTIGSTTVFTDARGVFSIKDATVLEQFAYAKATKVGYVDGSRSLVPTDGANKIKIILQDNNPTHVIQSGVQTTLDLPSGASIDLNGNYVNSLGETYQGVVQVVFNHITNQDVDLYEKMQGMLIGQNTQGGERLLETFGMLNVELIADNGEPLFLPENEIATIRIPQNGVQEVTTLWEFDKTYGFWVEKANTNMSGNAIVGEISSFGHWNYASASTSVAFCLDVVTDSNMPLANIKVSFNNDENTTIETKLTNELGSVCTYLPSNSVITVQLYDICDQVIFTKEVQTGNVDLATTFVLPNSIITPVTIEGTFYDCDLLEIANGYVFLQKDGNQYVDFIYNGNYTINTVLCGSPDASAYGVDVNTGAASNIINFKLEAPLTALGTFAACPTLEGVTQYAIFQVDNNPVQMYTTNFIWTPIGVPTASYLISQNNLPVNNLSFVFGANAMNELSLGNYTYSETFTIATIGENEMLFQVNDDDMIANPEPGSNMTIEVTNFGAVGEYFDFNFSGTYFFGSTEFTINGTMHILRTQ